tara:strand:+ start:8331 stop:8522 length:192 start_codon:yes stop_codon:yes gene_type:complete
MKTYEKEWCSVTLMNRFKICLKFEFSPRQIDLLMIGAQLTNGIAITILGVSVMIEWNVVKKKK